MIISSHLALENCLVHAFFYAPIIFPGDVDTHASSSTSPGRMYAITAQDFCSTRLFVSGMLQ